MRDQKIKNCSQTGRVSIVEAKFAVNNRRGKTVFSLIFFLRIYLFMHSCIHLFVHSSVLHMYLPICSFIHYLCNYSLTCLYIRLYISSLIYLLVFIHFKYWIIPSLWHNNKVGNIGVAEPLWLTGCWVLQMLWFCEIFLANISLFCSLIIYYMLRLRRPQKNGTDSSFQRAFHNTVHKHASVVR